MFLRASSAIRPADAPRARPWSAPPPGRRGRRGRWYRPCRRGPRRARRPARRAGARAGRSRRRRRISRHRPRPPARRRGGARARGGAGDGQGGAGGRAATKALSSAAPSAAGRRRGMAAGGAGAVQRGVEGGLLDAAGGGRGLLPPGGHQAGHRPGCAGARSCRRPRRRGRAAARAPRSPAPGRGRAAGEGADQPRLGQVLPVDAVRVAPERQLVAEAPAQQEGVEVADQPAVGPEIERGRGPRRRLGQREIRTDPAPGGGALRVGRRARRRQQRLPAGRVERPVGQADEAQAGGRGEDRRRVGLRPEGGGVDDEARRGLGVELGRPLAGGERQLRRRRRAVAQEPGGGAGRPARGGGGEERLGRGPAAGAGDEDRLRLGEEGRAGAEAPRLARPAPAPAPAPPRPAGAGAPCRAGRAPPAPPARRPAPRRSPPGSRSRTARTSFWRKERRTGVAGGTAVEEDMRALGTDGRRATIEGAGGDG